MQANFTAKQRCSLTPAVRHPAITTVKMRKYYLISWNGLFTTHENGLIFFFFYKAHTVNGMVSIYVASRGQEHTSNCCHSSCCTERLLYGSEAVLKTGCMLPLHAPRSSVHCFHDCDFSGGGLRTSTRICHALHLLSSSLSFVSWWIARNGRTLSLKYLSDVNNS